MTAPVQLPPDLPEVVWTEWVITAAKYHGWKAVHFRPAKTAKGYRTPVTGDKGSPDILLARDGDVLLAELKSAAGQLSPEQREWLEHLGPLAVVWRPKDAPAVLERLSRPRGSQIAAGTFSPPGPLRTTRPARSARSGELSRHSSPTPTERTDQP